MQVNLEHSEAPVRDAATVVMLRDAQDGLEVFLLKRHGLSDVLGGAYVFPGGKVDHSDADLDIHTYLDRAAEPLLAALGEPQLHEGAAATLYIAALREAFEETGVLYAQDVHARDASLASELLREGRSFEEVLAMMKLRLATAALQPWSRWITPAVGGVMRKRFDTRFFLAAVPTDQQPRHDNHEAIDSAWFTPRQALQQCWDRQIELAPPQIMSLAHLSRHATVESAMSEARERPPPLIHPEPFEHAGERVICYPGDDHHSTRERAMPGPTRLHYRNQRFEPEHGFEALFD